MATIEHWKDILLEASRQNFASSKQGIILAKVPSILYNSGIEKEEILSGGRKLRELLASEAQTHLRLIQNEDSPLDWAVLPADLSISEPYSKYFPQPKTTDESVAPRRFISAFWQAFTRHIPNGHRRWLTRSPRLSFEDRIGGTPRADEIEIERKYTAKPDEFVVANSEILNRIENWANIHAINPTDFYAKIPQNINLNVSKHSGQNLVDMIRGMTPDEMSRISIPLDIVARYFSSSKDK